MGISEEEKMEKLKGFIGTDFGKKSSRVKGKNMVAFAKSIFDENPKYTQVGTDSEGKPDYSGIVAHPAFPASFTVNTGGPLYNMIGLKYENGDPVIKNPGKLLHTAQKYDYTNCVPIKHGMKLTTNGIVSNMEIKAGILWIESELTTLNEKSELVVKTTVNVGIRSGGW